MRTIGVIGAPSSAGAYAPGQEQTPAGPARHRIAARSRRPRRRGQRPRRHAALALGPGPGVASRAERRRRRCHHRGGRRRGRRISGRRRAGAGARRRLHGRPRRRARTGRDARLRPAVPRHARRHEHAREHARRRARLDGRRAPARAGRHGARPRARRAAAPRQISMLGFEESQATAWEHQQIADLEIATTSAAALIANPGQAAAEALAVLPAGTDRVAVHFDVDVIDFVDAPLSQNTGRNVGVPMASALAALETLLADPQGGDADGDRAESPARRGGRLDAPGVQPRFVVSRGGLVDDLGGTTADPPSATRSRPLERVRPRVVRAGRATDVSRITPERPNPCAAGRTTFAAVSSRVRDACGTVRVPCRTAPPSGASSARPSHSPPSRRDGPTAAAAPRRRTPAGSRGTAHGRR